MADKVIDGVDWGSGLFRLPTRGSASPLATPVRGVAGAASRQVDHAEVLDMFSGGMCSGDGRWSSEPACGGSRLFH